MELGCISHCGDKLYVYDGELLFGACIVASCIELFSMHGYNCYNVICNSSKSLAIYKYTITGLLPVFAKLLTFIMDQQTENIAAQRN